MSQEIAAQPTCAALRASMNALGLPVQDEERLEAIMRVCGPQFSAALHSVANSGKSANEDKEFVSLVLRSITPQVESAIRQLRLEVPSLDGLIRISLDEGSVFRKSLHNAISENETAAESISYVKAVLQKYASQHNANAAGRDYRSVTVYGSKSALCINADQNRSGEQVVRLEGAVKSGDAFDWKAKIGVQLSVGECVLLLAALCGKINSKVMFSGHGSRHDKWASIEYQEGHFFVTVGQKSKPAIGIQITALDIYPSASLLWDQLLRNDPHLDLAAVRNAVAMTAKLFNENAARKSPRAA